MRLDAELRRRAEVDTINGSVVFELAELGVPNARELVDRDLAHAAECSYIHAAGVTRIR